jgi:hypothetical protein
MSVIQDGKLMAFNVIQQVMNDFIMVACPAHRTDLPPGASEAPPERSPLGACASRVEPASIICRFRFCQTPRNVLFWKWIKREKL